MPDPIPGDRIPEVIEDGLVLLETDAEYAVIASTWRQILAEDASMDELQRLRAALFSTPTGMLALGADELAGSDDGASGDGLLSEVIISIPGAAPIEPVTSDDP